MPHAQRAEGAAHIWTYGGDACRLDLYFFRDVASGSLHALAYRIEGEAPAEAACRSFSRGPS